MIYKINLRIFWEIPVTGHKSKKPTSSVTSIVDPRIKEKKIELVLYVGTNPIRI